MDEACAPEILYVRAREAVDGMLTLRASKVVVSVRKRSLMCTGKSLARRSRTTAVADSGHGTRLSPLVDACPATRRLRGSDETAEDKNK